MAALQGDLDNKFFSRIDDIDGIDVKMEGDAKQDNWFTPHNPTFPYDDVYEPLDLDKDQIRLVRLLPGDSGSPILCEILSSCLALDIKQREATVSYIALSYCAGDPRDCCAISFNGRPFNIFRSLFLALLYFREPNEQLILWLDQLCINQTNIEEREAQVLLMKDVYSHAQCTYVWLGEAVEGTAGASNLVRDYLAACREGLVESIRKYDTYGDSYLSSERKTLNLFPDNLADFLESERLWFSQLEEIDPHLKEYVSQDSGLMQACEWLRSAWNNTTHTPAWSGIADLLQRPWWSRCWIVQEIVMSGRILICCGLHRFLWDDLVFLLHGVKYLRYAFPLAFKDSVSPSGFPWNSLGKIANARRHFSSFLLEA